MLLSLTENLILFRTGTYPINMPRNNKNKNRNRNNSRAQQQTPSPNKNEISTNSTSTDDQTVKPDNKLNVEEKLEQLTPSAILLTQTKVDIDSDEKLKTDEAIFVENQSHEELPSEASAIVTTEIDADEKPKADENISVENQQQIVSHEKSPSVASAIEITQTKVDIDADEKRKADKYILVEKAHEKSPSETQTTNKKRNRHQNRKKNTLNTNEHDVSSSTTIETHENNPSNLLLVDALATTPNVLDAQIQENLTEAVSSSDEEIKQSNSDESNIAIEIASNQPSDDVTSTEKQDQMVEVIENKHVVELQTEEKSLEVIDESASKTESQQHNEPVKEDYNAKQQDEGNAQAKLSRNARKSQKMNKKQNQNEKTKSISPIPSDKKKLNDNESISKNVKTKDNVQLAENEMLHLPSESNEAKGEQVRDESLGKNQDKSDICHEASVLLEAEQKIDDTELSTDQVSIAENEGSKKSDESKENENSVENPLAIETDEAKADQTTIHSNISEQAVEIKENNQTEAKNTTENVVPAEENDEKISFETELNLASNNNVETSDNTLCDEITKSPRSSPILTAQISEANESAKKSNPQEDETAKIWKILEEASKSLEPVEIQIDDDTVVPSVKAEPIVIETSLTPIVTPVKDEKQAKEAAENLASILETKKPIAEKTSSPVKLNKTKEMPQTKENMQKKKANETRNVETTQTSKKSIQSKKKESPTTTNQKQIKQMPPDKPPPIQEVNLVANDDIPLDISILPNAHETEIEMEAESQIDSKNVQGSDFVPSVESTSTDATKSLTPKPVNIKQQNDAKEKSKSPISKIKSKIDAKPSLQIGKKADQVLASNNNKNNKQTQPTVQSNGNLKKNATANAENKKIDQEKALAKETSNRKESNCNNNTNRRSSDEIKSSKFNTKETPSNDKAQVSTNRKPSVPPKPEHLVSSNANAKKTPSTSPHLPIKTEAKSNDTTEKKLLLTGAVSDEYDSEEDYIEYKFMPRQVFISTICQFCKTPKKPSEANYLCKSCQMISYCSDEHMQKDESNHKDLCDAIQEIARKRGEFIVISVIE